ncbi:flavodoxin family protein [Euzebya tangerina]|uniref:flavodoxin family protein n=1 Tax=Euzebya tangerina TaxID=591198 RepID=UPI000E32296F|nr:NAD(P)H-dependent oxidoreductase [Euzebya tangerina]
MSTAEEPTPPASYDDLQAVFINCSLKTDPAASHTQKLMDRSIAIMENVGIDVTTIHARTAGIATGIYPDMTEASGAAGQVESDAWPGLMRDVILPANILVIGTPIWLGMHSSVCTQVIERLYSWSGEHNDQGQYVFYGRAGGCLVTGNEDGVKHVAMSVLYAMQHVGYTIPPQADAGWIGEVGPGASYGDEPEEGGPPVGFDNDFTNRNTTFMTWNLIHTARLLADAGGMPAYGNQREKWFDGQRFGFPESPPAQNPEYR